MKINPMRIIALIILILGIAGTGISGSVIDRTIAKLNDDILTESDLAEVIAEASGRMNARRRSGFEDATTESVQSMFDRALLLQEARRMKINAPADEMNRQVELMVQEIRAKFRTEKEFHQALVEERISLDQLKHELLEKSKTDFQVYHVVNSRYSVSDDEVKSFETATSGTASNSIVSYRLRRLGIEVTKKQPAEAAKQKARQVVSQIITKGISFEEGVRLYSNVPGAEADAGDMGYMSSDKLNSEVRNAVEYLEIGQASRPIVAGGFANIFYVEGKRGAKSAVREKKFFEARNQLLTEVRRKANLRVFDQRLMLLLPDDYRSALREGISTVNEARARDSTTPGGSQSIDQPSRTIQVTPAPTAHRQDFTAQEEQPRGLKRWFGRHK